MNYSSLLLVYATAATISLASPDASTTSPHELPENAIMEIDDWTVPSEWFLHEFRSTFFRYGDAENVREAVFDPFQKRMILYAQARREKIDQQPELQSSIEQRLKAMRAYMDYQLEMTRVAMVNEAFIDTLNIEELPSSITDDETEAYFQKNIRSRPGAPDSLKSAPPEAIATIREQIAQEKLEDRLNALVQEWRTNMTITVRREAIEQVPLPSMEGPRPTGGNVVR